MRIAFYAPMKAPDHPIPSGDRLLGRLLMAALERRGHEVDLLCRFRSWDRTGQRQERLKRAGEYLAQRLIRGILAKPEAERPKLWFTYHLYHKAPDWIGPKVATALGIPYVLAEASVAGKQAHGRWAIGYDGALEALKAADLVVGLNPVDQAGIEPFLKPGCRRLTLRPFIDTEPFQALRRDRDGKQSAVPWLIAVGMLRAGDKQASYTLLAQSLIQIQHLPWRLIVIGDGPARGEIQAVFAPIADRVHWTGALEANEVRRWLASCDLCVWPAINEAFGMALLEAQAAGLPVVAGNAGGVATIVRDGETGRLVPVGAIDRFAAGIAEFLQNETQRAAFGATAKHLSRQDHDIEQASLQLDAELSRVVQ
ncbi:glycosyltransferase family 4 protein [Lacibacterium aquatile]|uniref:Glycosyltransferase family 4 protein n=1 Tax=Lacibacterium aquatile TaxID=1168082 RepID=A0ABW5DTM5_9PROT